MAIQSINRTLVSISTMNSLLRAKPSQNATGFVPNVVGLAAVSIVLVGQVAAAQVVFTIGSNDAHGPMALGRIDVGAESYTEVSPSLAGGETFLNLSWSESIGGFYSVLHPSGDAGFFGDLRTVTTAGTVSGSLGTLYSDAYAMSLRPDDGRLYTIDAKSVSYWAIDPAAGFSESLLTPSMGLGFEPGGPAGGRLVVHQGSLFAAVNDSAASTGRFGSLGFGSGAAFVQIGANDPLFTDMVLASDGTTLFGLVGVNASLVSLFVIDPETGSLGSPVSIVGANIPRYFTGAAAVPEPEDACWVVGVVLVGRVLLARWFRRAAGSAHFLRTPRLPDASSLRGSRGPIPCGEGRAWWP